MVVLWVFFPSLYFFQRLLLTRLFISFRPLEVSISCCAKACLSPPPPKHAEVFQSATCFLLMFDSHSQLPLDEPHQLLGFHSECSWHRGLTAILMFGVENFMVSVISSFRLLSLKIFWFWASPRELACLAWFLLNSVPYLSRGCAVG